MMRPRTFTIPMLVAVPLLVSCSTTQVPQLVHNPRVIIRDLLSVPNAYSRPTPATLPATNSPVVAVQVAVDTTIAPSQEQKCEIEQGSPGNDKPAIETPVAQDHSFFVQFANESAELEPTALPIAELTPLITPNVHVFVIGQSHGPSAVGTQRLSTLRAERVAGALRDASIDASRIHTLASWGSAKDPYTPTRGVNILLLSDTSPQWHVLLSLSKQGQPAS
jgi:outer membrane protein OmpA-like peptidoglycan-associated protein